MLQCGRLLHMHQANITIIFLYIVFAPAAYPMVSASDPVVLQCSEVSAESAAVCPCVPRGLHCLQHPGLPGHSPLLGLLKDKNICEDLQIYSYHYLHFLIMNSCNVLSNFSVVYFHPQISSSLSHFLFLC